MGSIESVGDSKGVGAIRPLTRHPRLLPVVFCDIDGTVNDHRVPEPLRLSTVGAAQAALRPLAALGIPVVLATARSLDEARRYAAALGAAPVCIAEDGAVLGAAAAELLTAPGAAPLAAIRGLLAELRASGQLQDGCASCDPPSVWATAPGAEAVAILRRSRRRLASAIVLGLPAAAEAAVERAAPAHGLRTLGGLLHLLPAGVDKGTAVHAVHRRAGRLFGGGVDGVVPLAVGNDANDVPLFRAAGDLGGMAALVGCGAAAPPDVEDLPWLLRVEQPHGHGLAAALRRMLPAVL